MMMYTFLIAFFKFSFQFYSAFCRGYSKHDWDGKEYTISKEWHTALIYWINYGWFRRYLVSSKVSLIWSISFMDSRNFSSALFRKVWFSHHLCQIAKQILISCYDLKLRQIKSGVIDFEKEDDEIMKFITAAAVLRAIIFAKIPETFIQSQS